jgi:hypothetical protein
MIMVAVASCRSTKKIQTAIAKKDTVVALPPDAKKNDSSLKIMSALQGLKGNQINYTTFSAKVNVDYKSGDGKNYDVNASIRMYKDSAIWLSANAILGIEAMRVLITRTR